MCLDLIFITKISVSECTVVDYHCINQYFQTPEWDIFGVKSSKYSPIVYSVLLFLNLRILKITNGPWSEAHSAWVQLALFGNSNLLGIRPQGKI